MARVDIFEDTLLLQLSLWERLGGFVRGDARIPLTAVRRARVVEAPWVELRGMRSPGTRLSKRSAVGTWRFSGGKDFAAIHGRGPGVVVELVGLDFARLVFSSSEAETVAAWINESAGAARLRAGRSSS